MYGSCLVLEFEADSISLNILQEGVVMESWTIHPLVRLEVMIICRHPFYYRHVVLYTEDYRPQRPYSGYFQRLNFTNLWVMVDCVVCAQTTLIWFIVLWVNISWFVSQPWKQWNYYQNAHYMVVLNQSPIWSSQYYTLEAYLITCRVKYKHYKSIMYI